MFPNCLCQLSSCIFTSTHVNLCNTVVYGDITSDGHRLEDMFVQLIESIVVAPNERASTYSKCLEREEFWIRELKTAYPYGLNDNIHGVRNISKQNDELIVWNEEEGYLLPTIARKITCRRFD